MDGISDILDIPVNISDAFIHKSSLHFMIAATLAKAMWGTRPNMELFCPPKHGPPHWQLGQLVEFWNNMEQHKVNIKSTYFTIFTFRIRKDQLARLAQFLGWSLESRNVNPAKV